MRTLEQLQAYRKAYYEKNKQKINSYARQWQKDHTEIVNARAKAAYNKNPKAVLARQRLWQQANKDKIAAYARKSYAKNKTKYAARAKKWQQENKDKLKINQTRYYQAHPDVIKKANKRAVDKLRLTVDGKFLLRCFTRRKQAKRKYPHFRDNRRDIKKETFRELVARQGCKCAITGVSLKLLDQTTGIEHRIYEVDHIIPCNQPGSFHGKDNVQLVAPSANKIKGGLKTL